MDNAREYNDHRSGDWMGRALRGRRDKVFLMTKCCTHGRDKADQHGLHFDTVGRYVLSRSVIVVSADFYDCYSFLFCAEADQVTRLHSDEGQQCDILPHSATITRG